MKLDSRQSNNAVNDYFTYLPERDDTSLWGCVATSAGMTHVPPHSVYPPKRHPLDHHFDWAQGRVLQAYQIILISEGSGIFENEAGAFPVTGGDILLLFPGVWHRYAPSQETGWVEHWMEFKGTVFDKALACGIIQRQSPILHASRTADAFFCFERCHAIVQKGALAGQDMLSTLGLHLLSILARIQQQEHQQSMDAKIDRAQALITLRCQESLNLRKLASELGVSYSYLRSNFKRQIGISPKQFHLQVRLYKARDLLANTSKSVKEIADILGFESPFHLSKQFKKRVGESPVTWRKKQNIPR